jgi:HEXXH motif-containing protein
MVGYLRLPFVTFREISTGVTGPDGLNVLDAAHRNRQYLLLRMVVDRMPAGARARGLVKDALDLLAFVQREHHAAFDAVLTYPHVGAGLVRCMRELSSEADVPSACRYLATVAAAAALRAGVDFDLGVAATASLHIPATGTAQIGTNLPEVRLRQRHGHRSVGPVAAASAPDGYSGEWSPVRRLDTAAFGGHDVVLDDLDPDRGAGGLFPAGRLHPAEYTVWNDLFARAAAQLAVHHPVWAGQVGRVVRVVTPLARQRPNQGRSATTWQAYGAVALTRPDDEFAMAAALVHELQHSKLNMLMTLIDLYDRTDPSLHYSPWRADPRPLRGLLHGCYAFLGVAMWWSAARAAAGSRADYEAARSALQVHQALETLATARGLTPAGREFVAGMAESLATLAAGPHSVRHLAELAVDDHRVSWRLRSVVPDAEAVADIAAAWRAGRPVSSLPVTAMLAGTAETFVPNDRIRLWGRLARRPIPEGDDADILLARQAHEPAAKRYLEALRHDPDSTQTWAGLAIAAARIDGPDRQLWRCRPELIRAVHRALRDSGGESPDPLTLAGWLAVG